MYGRKIMRLRGTSSHGNKATIYYSKSAPALPGLCSRIIRLTYNKGKVTVSKGTIHAVRGVATLDARPNTPSDPVYISLQFQFSILYRCGGI